MRQPFLILYDKPQFESYGDMVEYLATRGIDVATFDDVSSKTLADLFKECHEREVRLDFVNGRVWRIATTVRVLLFAENRRYLLRELWRRYKRTGDVVYKNPYASLTGTLKRGMLLEDTVVDEVNQECRKKRLVITKKQVEPITAQHIIDPAFGIDQRVISDKPEERDSTAYANIRSSSNNHWFQVLCQDLPWTESPTML